MRFIKGHPLTLLASLALFISIGVGSAHSGDQLHKAAYNGDIEKVRSLLQEQVDPDERDSFGGTALHAAMFQKNLEIIQLLIDAGLDVNAQGSSNGYTPLHDAVWADNLGAIELLIENGARTDIKSNDGLTPYQKALKEKKKELVPHLQ